MDIGDIHWLGHDSFRLEGSTVIYVDPWKLPEDVPLADGILVTHDHYDHLSVDDIRAIAGPETDIAGPEAVTGHLDELGSLTVAPGETFRLATANVRAVPAYNIDKFRQPGKPYHPKEAGYVGYIIELDGFRVYHAGDTDCIPEMRGIRCDVALLPVGGTYTMTADEACRACGLIDAGVVVPMHWGDIVGSRKDAERFRKGCGRPVEILPLERG